MSVHLTGSTTQESLSLVSCMAHKHLRGLLNDLMEHAAPTSLDVSVSQESDGWLRTRTIHR